MDGGTGERRSAATSLDAIAALAATIGDLKRVRDARGADSLATRAFRAAWAGLCAGESPARVADGITADVLAATLLGGIDKAVLGLAGVADPLPILLRGFDEAAHAIPEAARGRLRQAVAQLPGGSWPVSALPDAPGFVEALARQPRAGATCPGKPRIVLEPAENHADHCLAVAVIGVALCERYGADPATVFLAGLCHHFHNAALPDSGFAGEILLGEALAPMMAHLFAREVARLPPHLVPPVQAALRVIADAETPEGRAFHAADVIDRVLQMRHFERVAQFRARHALEDLNLVHEGPVQAFHHAVLEQAGLL